MNPKFIALVSHWAQENGHGDKSFKEKLELLNKQNISANENVKSNLTKLGKSDKLKIIDRIDDLEKVLNNQIKQAVKLYPAKFRGTTKFWDSYGIVTVIKGITGRKAKVVLGARVDKDNSKIVTVYIKEVTEVKQNADT